MGAHGSDRERVGRVKGIVKNGASVGTMAGTGKVGEVTILRIRV